MRTQPRRHHRFAQNIAKDNAKDNAKAKNNANASLEAAHCCRPPVAVPAKNGLTGLKKREKTHARRP